MKKIIALTILLGMKVQIGNCQSHSALISDVIDSSRFSSLNYTSGLTNVTYRYSGYPINTYDGFIPFDNPTTSGVYVTNVSKPMVLYRIEATRPSNIGRANSVNVYVKNTNYTKGADLYNSETCGINITSLGFTNESTQTSILNTGNYRYFGISKGNGDAAIKSLTVTWQLAHFRDNLTIGKVGTICLPYDVCADDLSDEITAYSIAGKVMDAQEEKVETVVFEAVDKLEAGVPYLFVSKKTDVCLKYSYEESKAGEYPITQAGNKNGLYGSFENHVFTTDECKDNDLFLISNNQINLAGAGAGVGANRAYIKMSEVPPYVEAGSSRKLLLTANGFEEVDGVTTIVPKVATYGNVHGSSTYDLQGRRSFNSFGAGIILQDGKKKFVDGK